MKSIGIYSKQDLVLHDMRLVTTLVQCVFKVAQELSRVIIMRKMSDAVSQSRALECCLEPFALPSATFPATTSDELPAS